MLSDAAYRIVYMAIQLRVANGEPVEEVVRYYTKLSEEQMSKIIEEMTGKKESKEL